MSMKHLRFSYSRYFQNWAKVVGTRLLSVAAAMLLAATMLIGLTPVVNAGELAGGVLSTQNVAEVIVAPPDYQTPASNTNVPSSTADASGTTSTTVSNTPSSASTITTAAKEQGIFILDILELPVPLESPRGYVAWSLFDLICTIAGLITLAFVGVYLLIPPRQTRRDGASAAEGEQFDEDSYWLKEAHDAHFNENNYWLDQERDMQEAQDLCFDEDDDGLKDDVARPPRQARRVFLVATASATTVGVILFMLTQDITQPAVLFGAWSMAFSVLLVACVLCARLAFTQPRKPRTYHEPLPTLPASTPRSI